MSMIPDIGVPISAFTRYRIYTDIGRGTIPQYTDIGVHTPISFHLCIRYHVSECSDVVNIAPVIGPGPGARLSGCCRLFGFAKGGMINLISGSHHLAWARGCKVARQLGSSPRSGAGAGDGAGGGGFHVAPGPGGLPAAKPP